MREDVCYGRDVEYRCGLFIGSRKWVWCSLMSILFVGWCCPRRYRLLFEEFPNQVVSQRFEMGCYRLFGCL